MPVLFPPALVRIADRLATALMRLVDPVSEAALHGNNPHLSKQAAETLFARLAHLVMTLIRISNFGVRCRADSAAPAEIAPEPPDPEPRSSSPTPPVARHPGWLLAALPDIAPAVAADLAALLADPAYTLLFAAMPTLQRDLRPLLRGLDLAAPEPPPTPDLSPPPDLTPAPIPLPSSPQAEPPLAPPKLAAA